MNLVRAVQYEGSRCCGLTAIRSAADRGLKWYIIHRNKFEKAYDIGINQDYHPKASIGCILNFLDMAIYSVSF